MIGLAPGVTITISGVALTRRREKESSTIACRSSGRPAEGP